MCSYDGDDDSMSQLGSRDGIGIAVISVTISFFLIFIISYYIMPVCETEACIWKEQTPYYPLILLSIVAGVVVGILVVFSRDEKNE